MGADVKIHVLDGELTKEHVREFKSSTLGSPYMGANTSVSEDEALDAFIESPSVPVGEASNLKAALTGDRDSYQPPVTQVVQDYFGGAVRTITDELIEKVEASVEVEKENDYKTNDVNDVLEFLREHSGEEACTVAW